ncbi:MAG: CHAT domain-containing protein, partial [Caulobacterales bacterium]
TLIVFLTPPGANKGLVFAVSKAGAAWAQLGFTGDELKARVIRLRAQIDPLGYGVQAAAPGVGLTPGLKHGVFDRQASYELYKALLGDPAIQAVIKDRGVLLFVPTGPLTSLPPGLLVTSPPVGGAAGDSDQAILRATPWLLRSKAVALLPSVATLRTLRQLMPSEHASTPDPLLAFADPDFRGQAASAPKPVAVTAVPRGVGAYFRDGRALASALSTLPRLPGTRVEGQALEQALGAPPASLLTGADASKAELMARNADGRLAKVRVLEFATHGLVTGDAGIAEPALALAAGARPEDELLLASEASTLTLNADWVLLSACNTASPDAPEAQGLSGLARAFFFAGARSLLVSHWRVRDDVAGRLIPGVVLAQRNTPGLSHAQALRQASLAILDDPTIRGGANPSAWAPFTVIGEAGP